MASNNINRRVVCKLILGLVFMCSVFSIAMADEPPVVDEPVNPIKPTPNRPSANTVVPVIKTSDISDDSDDPQIKYFNNLFNSLITPDLGDDFRIEMAEGYVKDIGNKATMKIQILANNSDVVVDQQSLEDYIGRLATTHIMQGVSVVEVSEDMLVVRESFKTTK